jgi:tetratricopeptide (TPR) repeat protein
VLQAGAIRLRSLATNLFVPADAELIPPLLPDEAAALVRDRGLVFLPGGRVLGFDPARPLTAADLVSCPRRPARGWRPIPDRPNRPERLRQIRLEVRDETPDDILQAGAGGIGTETPRPSAGFPGAQVAGGAALGAGQGLMWLGRVLGLQGLARLGARLARRAVEIVPRLSESLLGRQEAALRELLRKFREGRVDEALRRALPLADRIPRGSRPTLDNRLPVNDLHYQLRDLLGSGRGPKALWMSSAEVHTELAREYRKAAEDATARGDWRRAAFIWGMLLHDFRAAAAVLERGGLHHDAAILYLEKLSDTLAAARAFEAAGEIDRALQLYRHRGDHVAAGDLLRRAGEEGLALEEYRQAAAHLAAAENHLAAGELLLDRGRRLDLALAFFAVGWARRPEGTAVGCLMRLLEASAAEDSPANLLSLIAEADAFFGPPGNDAAARRFYNTLAALAQKEHLAAVQEELRDRALVGLANKLRQQAGEESRPGNVVSTLLGNSGTWTPAQVADADFAFKAALRKPPPPRSARVQRIHVVQGRVTAVCAAAETGQVFLGLAAGGWAAFDPQGGKSFHSGGPAGPPVLALSTDRYGSAVLVLHESTPEERLLTSYLAGDGTFTRQQEQALARSIAACRLTPIGDLGGQQVFGLRHDGRLTQMYADDLLPTGEVTAPESADAIGAALLLPDAAAGQPAVWLLFAGNRLWLSAVNGTPKEVPGTLGWRPGWLHRVLLSAPPLAWRVWGPDELEFAGLDQEGVHWAHVNFNTPWAPPSWSPMMAAVAGQTGYLAVAFIGPGRLAAVRRMGVDWLRREGKRLVLTSSTGLGLEAAVACFHSPLTGELLVVCRDGWLVRLPVPH